MLLWSDVIRWSCPWLHYIFCISQPAGYSRQGYYTLIEGIKIQAWIRIMGPSMQTCDIKMRLHRGNRMLYQAFVTVMDVLAGIQKNGYCLSPSPYKVSGRQQLGLSSWWLESCIDLDHTEEHAVIDLPEDSERDLITCDFSRFLRILHEQRHSLSSGQHRKDYAIVEKAFLCVCRGNEIEYPL